MNALAGGATLLTFPVMIAAGLSPVIANASSAVAISPGHILAALSDRESMPALDRRFWILSAATTIGGGVGALILLSIPSNFFTLPVPALIAFATLLNLLATFVTATAVLIFIILGAVDWPTTGCMLLGALVGGYAGGHLIRVLPASAVRGFIIVTGACGLHAELGSLDAFERQSAI